MDKKVILVADDIEMNRVVVRESIGTDFEVLEAANGEEALEILYQQNGIDAVITDIQMPVMDGTELIRHIREDQQFRHVAILANTQYGTPQQEELLLAMGVNDLVYKPTTPKILKMTLHNALHQL